jgi:hypothetical protein
LIMTMHLQRGLTTLRTRRPQFKMTRAKEASWRDDFAVYNRELRRQGEPRLTWEQYMDMRLGRGARRVEPKRTTLSVLPGSHPRYQDRTHIPSLDIVAGHTNLRESIKYTGTLVKGIATMHKSNAVPVIDEEQMKDISRMRRG